MKKLREITSALSDIFFPKSFTCDICGIETFGTNLCPSCLKTVTYNDKASCPICGRRTVRPEICLECKYHAPRYKKGASAFVYEGGAVILIAKFKNGRGYLKDYFADKIAEKLKYFPKADCIVSIPMTKKAENKRGYNQAEILAKSISERTGIPFLKRALVKTKETAEQKTLTFRERIENLADCFKVEKRGVIKDKEILLVDDVLTTGATADAACKKLLDAGAKRIYFVTVASVEYKQNKEEKKTDKPSKD